MRRRHLLSLVLSLLVSATPATAASSYSTWRSLHRLAAALPAGSTGPSSPLPATAASCPASSPSSSLRRRRPTPPLPPALPPPLIPRGEASLAGSTGPSSPRGSAHAAETSASPRRRRRRRGRHHPPPPGGGGALRHPAWDWGPVRQPRRRRVHPAPRRLVRRRRPLTRNRKRDMGLLAHASPPTGACLRGCIAHGIPDRQ